MSLEPDDIPAAAEFLGSFSDEQLRAIYAIAEAQQFAAGDVAVAEGDSDSSLYIILEGQAEVQISIAKGLHKVATLIPGSIFGELSFFDRMPRSARVSVSADCTVLKISEHSFNELISRDAGLALAFVQELSRVLSLRIRHMNELVQTLSK